MFRYLASLILLASILTVVAGCGGGQSGVTRNHFVEFTPDQKQEIDAKTGTEYRIQEGDLLRLAFSYLRELNQDGIVVLNDGSINLVGADRIVVAGLTMTEADSVITHAYSAEYRDPALSIIVQETVGRRVYVLGQVKNPGLHRVPSGGIDVIGAVGVAGGFSETAAEEGTVLVRVTEEGYLVQEIDLKDFSNLASASLAMLQVQPYDVIYVPRSRVGNFGYFSRTVLAGLVQITRIAADIKYLSGGSVGRLF